MRRTPLTLALLLALSQTARAQSDDLQALKSQVNQLQERLNQLSSPPQEKIDGVAPRPSVFWPGAQQQLPLSPYLGGCSTEACPKPETGAAWPLSARWDNGLQFESADDSFRVHVGGNLAFDYGWNAASHAVQFGPGGTGELADGADFRYARIRIDGTMYQHFEWVAEFDFANSVNNDTSTSPDTDRQS
jgi:hypothetical protein